MSYGSRQEVSHITGSKSGIGCGCRHFVLFGGVLWIYTYTVFPSVTGGDAGELLAEACQLGTPHPPGYPLLTILHHLLSRLVRTDVLQVLVRHPPTVCSNSAPGAVALAANLLAAVLGAATAVSMAVAVEEWTIGVGKVYNRGAAAAGALLFSLSPLAWEYNTGSEVFALNNFLVALAVVIAVRAARQPNVKEARIGAAVCGLALANQHSAVLVLAPLAVFVILALKREQLLSWRSFTALGLFWLPLGLSPCAYYITSSRNPQQGSWGDLSSIRGLVRHVLRHEYGTLRLGTTAPDDAGTLERIWGYLVDSKQQTLGAGPPLALLGVVWAILVPALGSSKASHEAKRMRVFGIGLSAALAFYVVVWHSVFSNISLQHPMSRAVHARFWIQPNLLLCVAAGAGIGLIINSTVAVCWHFWPAFCRPRRGAFMGVASLLTPVLMGAALMWLRWESMNRGAWSDEQPGWTMHLYGQALLSSLPDRALLLSHTDLDLNAARYLRVCEGLRTDVTHISLQMIPYPWWGTVQAKLHDGVIFPPILRGVSTKRESEGNAVLITRFLAANLPVGRHIFIDMQAVDEREIGAIGAYRGFSLIPHGLTFRVFPRMSAFESESFHEEIVLQLQSLGKCMQPAPTKKYPHGTWEFAASSVFWDAHYQAGLFFLSYAIAVRVNSSGAEQRRYALPALRQASGLLLRTLAAVDEHGAFSSSRADLLKNTALAQIRLFHGLQVSLLLARKSYPTILQQGSDTVPPVVEELVKEMLRAKDQCLRLIPRFLLESENDKDAEAFGREYITLRASN